MSYTIEVHPDSHGETIVYKPGTQRKAFWGRGGKHSDDSGEALANLIAEAAKSPRRDIQGIEIIREKTGSGKGKETINLKFVPKGVNQYAFFLTNYCVF